ncbi:MAG: hypothetical protein KGL19_16065, partial [Bacteroidota bacterium]|nr:hypothetical protein [Bacteroidota bacterium]
EWMTTGGFIITYIILGRSQAQLPHYIFIVFPLAAIVTAKFLYRLLFTDEIKIWRTIFTAFHVFIFVLLWLVLIVLLAYPFSSIPKYIAGLAALCFLLFIAILFSEKIKLPKLLTISLFTIIGINIFLNIAFYPTLLTFQKGSAFANYINQNKIDKNKVVMLGGNIGHSLAFYSQHIYPIKSSNEIVQGDLVIAKKDSLPIIQQKFKNTSIIRQVNSFSVTGLTLPFLNPATREKELEPYVLVLIKN